MFTVFNRSLLLYIVLSLVTVPFLLLAQQVHAQSVKGAATLGVANIVQVRDKKVKDGSIIASAKDGNYPSTTPYDSQVLGVVSRDAGIILNNSNNDGVPVISVGTVYVLVSAKEGAIKKGDYIATSTIPGVGVKAVKDGYVLGTALEDYNNGNPNQSDLIAVEFNLHYFNAKPTFPGSLSDIFKFALLPTKEGPTPLFKYVVAGLVVIASFVLAFMTFGRTAAKGVEALGRNPAASRIIHLGIIFNVGIVVIIVFAGLTVSFLILRL
jgi:F0F1-type ATP synthase membrane subunit c/vacuolar-type H+-ATPase subunit K